MKLMKLNSLIAIVCAAAASGFLFAACHRESNELAHNHDHSHAGHSHEAEHQHEPEHEHAEETQTAATPADGEIVIEPEKAAKLGIESTPLAPADFHEVIAVGGELTSSPASQSTVTARSAGIVSLKTAAAPGTFVNQGTAIATVSGRGMAGGDANESARVALEAAKRELDRITPLHADGIVSTRDYNAARQTYDAAKAAAGSTAGGSGTVATAPTSGQITQLLVSEGQFVDAGTPIAIIAGSSELTLKANLPQRNAAFLPTVSGARFRTSYSPEVLDITRFNGHRSSGTAATVATSGYIPVYFTLKNDGTLSAGSYCEVFLTGNKRENVLSVPESALSEQQGTYFVYVQLDDECYTKRPVTLGATSGDRREILSGINPGDRIVTKGTTFVRLAESSGVVPEGHSHNH